MNLLIIKGRLTRDPELTKIGETDLCKFTVAVDRAGKKGAPKSADFFNCAAWRGTAEFVGKYFKKGKEIIVRGSIHSRKVEEKTFWDVEVDRAYFCGSATERKPDDGFIVVDEEPPF